MTTFPAGWRTRAEALLLAARRFAATTRADLRDLWAVAIRGQAGISNPGDTPVGAGPVESAGQPPKAQPDRWTRLRPLAQQAANSAVRARSSLRTVNWPRLEARTSGSADRSNATETAESRARVRAARDALGASVLAQRGDDIATVLGRIEAADEAEVVLVVPRGVASLRTAAAWARLAGHARRRGLTLRVVAARSEVRHHARRTGLEAARTWRGLPGARTPLRLGALALPLALPRRRESLGARALVMAAVPLAALTGFAYFGPQARIEVSPPSTAVEEYVQVRVDSLAAAPDLATRSLPATTVQRPIRVVVSAPTTGSVPVGDRPAAVRLEFRSASDTAIEVPAGTVVRAEQHPGFATTDHATVPPGQRVGVDSIAVEPGTAGNLGPGAVHLLDGLPAELTVLNPLPSRGGTDRLAPGVAQVDVDRVRALAESVLAQAAVRDARTAYEGGLVLPDSVSVAILGQTPFQRLGEPAELFVAEYVAQAAVLVVLPETATAFAEAYLRSRLPADRDLVPGITQVVFDGAPRLEGGQPRAQVTLTGRSAARLDEEALASAVAGATPRDARARIRQELQLDVDPRVRMSPPWLPWPWLPRRADRIEVVLGPPDTVTPRPAQ